MSQNTHTRMPAQDPKALDGEGRPAMTLDECIDLKEAYPQCKFTYEEGIPRNEWAVRLMCQNGYIFPSGGYELGFASDNVGGIAQRVLALPFLTHKQDGDDGVNVYFDIAHFDTVAKIVKPKRKRTLSPEHLAKLQEANRQYRFGYGSK